MLPYVLLDVGSTLLFPDCSLVVRVAREHGQNLREDHLRQTMAQWVRAYDESIRQGQDAVQFARFLPWVLERMGAPAEIAAAVAAELERLDQVESLWSVTFPWVGQALNELTAQGYGLSVISNADGRVEQGLQKTGLAGYFDHIFDSHLVGYEKPDVRLFQHALNRLGLKPTRCVYVGDIYYIDVLGANRSDIAAVHLDPYGLYEGWSGYHIANVAALPRFLSQHGDLKNQAFFPLRDA